MPPPDVLGSDYLDLLSQFGLSPASFEPSSVNTADIEAFTATFVAHQGQESFAEYLKEALAKEIGSQISSANYRADFILQRSNRRIRRAISVSPSWAAAAEDKQVFVGEFPTGSINAEARKTANGYLILINTGLLYFVKQVIEALCSDQSNEQTLIEEIAHAVLAYLVRTDPVYGPMPNASDNLALTAQQLEFAVYDFIIAHEYGHLLRGHLDADEQNRMLAVDAASLPVINKSWEQEYEADEVGYALTLSEMKELNWQTVDRLLQSSEPPTNLQEWRDHMKLAGVLAALAAPTFFFVMEKLIVKAHSALHDVNFETQLTSTHPPSESRREKLESNAPFPYNHYLSYGAMLEDLIAPVTELTREFAERP